MLNDIINICGDKKAFLKSNTRRFSIMAFFLLLLLLLLTPSTILFLRAGACGAGFSEAEICNIFGGNRNWNRSGYKIVTREQVKDAGTSSYNILTGKLTASCGFWVGFALQNGSRCAEGDILRRLRNGEFDLK